MATIRIKDLSDNTELDRLAMRAIVGGARGGGKPLQAIAGIFEDRRVVDYPPGLRRASTSAAQKK